MKVNTLTNINTAIRKNEHIKNESLPANSSETPGRTRSPAQYHCGHRPSAQSAPKANVPFAPRGAACQNTDEEQRPLRSADTHSTACHESHGEQTAQRQRLHGCLFITKYI